MLRSLARGAAITALATVGLYATAEAANPVKGATYVGSRGGGTSSLIKKVSLKVTADGTSATALLYCGTARQPSGAPRFKIANGRFRAVRKTGSITLWTLSGRFVSRTKAVATLNVVTTCDGKGGSISLLKK
jgi:hypothetical protein